MGFVPSVPDLSPICLSPICPPKNARTRHPEPDGLIRHFLRKTGANAIRSFGAKCLHGIDPSRSSRRNASRR